MIYTDIILSFYIPVNSKKGTNYGKKTYFFKKVSFCN